MSDYQGEEEEKGYNSEGLVEDDMEFRDSPDTQERLES